MDARLDPDATSFLARGLSSNGCAAILPAVSRVRRLAGIADLGANERAELEAILAKVNTALSLLADDRGSGP